MGYQVLSQTRLCIVMFLAVMTCVALEAWEPALLNLGGWYMVHWLGEALPLVLLYRRANQLVTIEEEPVTIPPATETPVATATTQPAPITVQIGSGRTP